VVFCAALPAAAQTTLTVTPNPVAVYDTITVKLTGVCDYAGGAEAIMTNDPSVSVGTVVVPMAPDPNDGTGSTWIGTYTTTDTDVGYNIVAAEDGECQDAIATNGLEVVWLKDVYQPWWGYDTLFYGISTDPDTGNRNSETLQSTWAQDYDCFQLDMYPNDTTAANIVTWSSDVTIPWPSDKRYATIDAGYWNGPKTVSASLDNFTTANITNWVFWGYITYNGSSGFDTDDGLHFDNAGRQEGSALVGLPLDNPKTAGPVAGMGLDSSGLHDFSYARTKIEIIGHLEPSGVGDVLGDTEFTFNNQLWTYNWWKLASAPTGGYDEHGDWAADTGANGGSGFVTNVTQQVTPIHDKIFAIDAPGMTEYVGSTGKEGFAANFFNQFFIGTVPASDCNTWHSYFKADFDATLVGQDMVWEVTFDPSPNFGSYDLTLPATWDSSAWGGGN
jgi:hypothetical protein